MNIKDFTLTARALLFEEVSRLLEGVYGVLPDGTLEDIAKLPALQQLPEAQQTRQRIEQFLDEESATHGQKGAVAKLAREVAFTHLNRFAALKMMEARKLIRGTIDKGSSSNGYQFYLAENPEEEKLHEERKKPVDALGEERRDCAYRHFLLHVFGKISKEIKVLFDPTDLASQLFLRPTALKELLELLNDESMTEHWAPGNDETVGWIYQYFNEPDLEIFRGNTLVRVPQELIAARTQMFTPRWITEYLVQNTVGKLWQSIHPDTQILANWKYFVPDGENPKSTELPSLAKEISILDPACGTMHFGLSAFDALREIYQEEFERAGQDGWPQEPSVQNLNDIPAAIIKNNIFGIDIDLRAIQLSALTLYLRAKTVNKEAIIKVSNLVCADLLLLNGERIEEFIAECQFTQPIYERIIKLVWDELKHANHFGSLLRPELSIKSLIEKEAEAQGDLFDSGKLTNTSTPDFWEYLDVQIVRAFNNFADSHGNDNKYLTGVFTGDAIQGMKLLDVMMRQYDVVVANPPYLDTRDQNATLKSYISSNFPNSKRNLYAAITERSLGFLKPHGRLGIITGQSFMFISSFEKFRKKLLEEHVIETLAQFDYGLFEARVDTAAFTLRREPNAMARTEAVGTYFRLVRESDSLAKRLAFQSSRKALSNGETPVNVFHYKQSNFDAIPGSPWVYWITPELRNLFRNLPKLGDTSPPRQGLATGDNSRFLRYWWEVGQEDIVIDVKNHKEAVASGKTWLPYMKGGKFRRWWGNQDYVINWCNAGTELKEIATIRNESFYFKRGVTYGLLTSGRFSARLSPGGFIFDVAGSSTFPVDPIKTLGLLNSSLLYFILTLINPTVNFQVGDLARLPLPETTSEELNTFVETAITLSRADSAENEITYEFETPPWHGSLKSTFTAVQERKNELAETERKIDNEVFTLYDISDEDRAAIETELGTPVIVDNDSDESGDSDDDEAEDEINLDEDAALMRISKNWISYAVGVALGRFDVPENCNLQRSEDGLVTLHENGSNDLAIQVEEVLHALLGNAGEEEILKAALGSSERAALQRYLERHFFAEHLSRYRKRPIYWLLQSPKKEISYLVFHERVTADTLHQLRGLGHIGALINGLERGIDEQRTLSQTLEKAERRKVENDIEAMENRLRDAREFEKNLEAIINQQDETGAIVGWSPERDDGIAINLAPLRSIFPAWNKKDSDVAKAWKALEKGDYDWSKTARRYWPNRVLEQCKINKSYAIAHGIEEDGEAA